MKKPELNMNSSRLFHFMPNLDNLVETLKFGVPYTWQGERIPGGNLAYFTRAACFCDIPLHAISAHADTYGMFGIGVSKEAAKQYGISPVMYVHSSTPFLKTSSAQLKEWITQNREVAFRLKPFEGYPLLNGQDQAEGSRTKVIYYNEREWRAIPMDKDEPFEILTCKTLADIATRKQELKESHPTNQNRMHFDINKDIEYIIIPNRDSLPDVISVLSKIPRVVLEEALPKILFYDRIKSDI